MEDFLLHDKQFTKDELAIRDKYRNFAKKEINPIIDSAFENAQFPMDLIPKLGELGAYGMLLPHKYGGSEAGYIAYGLCCQELEYADSSIRSFISVQSSLVIYPILMFGSEFQKDKWLPLLASGKKVGCFALSEPDAGSDPASLQTTATKQGNDWVISGTKKWITNATLSDVAIIWAQTENGIQGFLVEKDTAGFETELITHKMSHRASMTGKITLKNCVVSEDNRLPGTEKGLLSALECLTQARYGIAWGAIGAAMACFDSALDYCKMRKQFDKSLAGFQLIQYDLSEMFCEIVKAQTLNLRIGQLKKAKESNYAMVSMAKMNACKTALDIARKARNMLGARGIILDYPVIRHMHNLEAVFTYEGTDNIHHLILGKYLTGIKAFD